MVKTPEAGVGRRIRHGRRSPYRRLNMARVNEFSDLAEVLLVMEPEKKLKGMGFSITGHLGRPRKDIIKIIEMAGGHFEKTVNWGVRYLITNEDWTNKTESIKFRKAERNGVKIISEAEFYALLND
jgi:NAD-dependent DNA ligase